jgi:prepilin-type N-terminal cleavage/methylation domain-containing protein
MRCSDRVKNQRGFTLMEVMTASLILSALIVGVGSGWVVADRETTNLITRQKAIFVADAEMERLTVLYGTTGFGGASTTGYNETAAFPSTRLIYPTTLDPLYLPAGQDYVTTSVSTFSTGPSSAFKVLVDSNFLSSINRAYIWVDQDHNVMGRISWTTSSIAPNCSDSDGCLCYGGLLGLGTSCSKLVFYMEYPYRLAAGKIVPDPNLQTLSLSTIVGRHT